LISPRSLLPPPSLLPLWLPLLSLSPSGTMSSRASNVTLIAEAPPGPAPALWPIRPELPAVLSGTKASPPPLSLLPPVPRPGSSKPMLSFGMGVSERRGRAWLATGCSGSD
ncbi:hypothetical protein Vretifemale_10662, partial [Volvox reticuliferus]